MLRSNLDRAEMFKKVMDFVDEKNYESIEKLYCTLASDDPETLQYILETPTVHDAITQVFNERHNRDQRRLLDYINENLRYMR